MTQPRAPRPWTAARAADLRVEPVSHRPSSGDPAWRAMDQAWRAEGLEADFQPGWARIRWNETGLLFDILFAGKNPGNKARRLNERTWELGEIAEIFLYEEGREEYIEVHVTPENQRLQLRWTPASFAAFRKNPADISPHTVKDPAWISSAVRIGAADWSAAAFLPTAALPIAPGGLSPRTRLRGAVCRYDLTSGSEVHSSTAPLREASYHRLQDYDPIVLQP